VRCCDQERMRTGVTRATQEFSGSFVFGDCGLKPAACEMLLGKLRPLGCSALYTTTVLGSKRLLFRAAVEGLSRVPCQSKYRHGSVVPLVRTEGGGPGWG